jgi:hypothetical protein
MAGQKGGVKILGGMTCVELPCFVFQTAGQWGAVTLNAKKLGARPGAYLAKLMTD